MDHEESSWNPDIVVKQEVIIENDEPPTELEYYSYLSDNEQESAEPPQSSVESMDSEETMDADSPIEREQENSSEDSQSFVPAIKKLKKLAAYSSKTDPDDPWHCTMCSHKCKSEKSMIMHIEKHVNNLENNSCCLICLMGFSTKKEFDDHRQTHHRLLNKNTKKRPITNHFPCKICGADFTSSNVLREHCRNVHGTYQVMPTLDCPECGKICAKTTIFSSHVVKHQQFKLCRYFCDTCRMPLLKGDVERHRHRHRDGRMSAVNGNVLWRTREDSPDPNGSDTQSIPDDLAPTELEQPAAVGEEEEKQQEEEEETRREPDIEKDLPSFAVMKTNAPTLAIVKEEVIIDDTDFEDEVW